MAKVTAFINELGRMPGVSSFLLIGENGRPLVESMADAERVGAMLQVVLLATGKIRDTLGMARLRHLSICDAGGGRLLVFPLGRFLLGVEQAADPPGLDLARDILNLIRSYQARAKQQ